MTARVLQDGYVAVMQARNALDFRNEIIRFAQTLGFQTVSAMAVVDHAPNDSEFRTIDNTPRGFSQTYHDAGLALVDPVMQHCKRAAVPIVWDQDTYVSHGQGNLWEHQARYGYHTGVMLALHLPGGRHFCFGVDRDRPLPSKPQAVTRIVADLQLFAVHAQDAAFRILAPAYTAIANEAAPSLTPRELEALRWTMDGKTAWEVGMIMHISERTAVLHLQNAMRKLECVNKHQAVLKAVRCGLLT